jgi:hypothetical protein
MLCALRTVGFHYTDVQPRARARQRVDAGLLPKGDNDGSFDSRVEIVERADGQSVITANGTNR